MPDRSGSYRPNRSTRPRRPKGLPVMAECVGAPEPQRYTRDGAIIRDVRSIPPEQSVVDVIAQSLLVTS